MVILQCFLREGLVILVVYGIYIPIGQVSASIIGTCNYFVEGDLGSFVNLYFSRYSLDTCLLIYKLCLLSFLPHTVLGKPHLGISLCRTKVQLSQHNQEQPRISN